MCPALNWFTVEVGVLDPVEVAVAVGRLATVVMLIGGADAQKPAAEAVSEAKLGDEGQNRA